MPDNAIYTDLPVRVPLATEPWGLLRSLRAARENVLTIIPEASTRQAVVSGHTGRPWHMVTDPGAVQRVLLDKVDAYPKSVVTKNLLRPAIGESLFIAEGKDWRWQRRTAAPAFSHRNVAALGPIMTAAAERSAGRIAAAGRRAVNMLDEMVHTTFDVIADVTFSEDAGGGATFDRAAVHRAIDDYIAEAGKVSVLDLLGVPDWVPRLGRIRSTDALDQMRAAADAAIDERAARGRAAVPDLLDLLLMGEDPKDGRKMTTGELRDNLLTFIVAGHETTALTLAWSLYLCAFDQEVQHAACEEAKAILNGRAAQASDVPQLPLIRQIIDEALRLYPPAGMVSRTAQEDDELAGAQVHKGDTVILPIYALHRSHQLWDAPDAFRPHRFETRPERYAYLPFGDGPRICIGASFAVQEAVIILATLLSRFHFTAVKGRGPKPVMILTLRPEGGVWLQARPA